MLLLIFLRQRRKSHPLLRRAEALAKVDGWQGDGLRTGVSNDNLVNSLLLGQIAFQSSTSTRTTMSEGERE